MSFIPTTPVDRRGASVLLEHEGARELLARTGIRPEHFRVFVLRTLIAERPELGLTLKPLASRRSETSPSFPY